MERGQLLAQHRPQARPVSLKIVVADDLPESALALLRAEAGCVDGVPAIAMFRPASSSRAAYFIRLNWHNDRIAQVRDFRYVPYIAGEAIFTACSSSVS